MPSPEAVKADLSGCGAIAQGLQNILAAGGRGLQVTVGEDAAIQQGSLRDAIKEGILGSSGAVPHACPLQPGLEKVSDSLVFLGGGLPNNFELAFHRSEKETKQRKSLKQHQLKKIFIEPL